ncbi:hypothetical protein PQQ77_24845 [Paraburkholderia strydomiana]|uniref:hypothetical protein n=1 Tax=Paraburkholderia strydomiana TaxID=1245417 RepID=UPI0038BC7FE4
MTTIYAQFSDATEAKILNCFAGPQDADVFPNQGSVDVEDERYVFFYKNAPDTIGLPRPPSLDAT